MAAAFTDDILNFKLRHEGALVSFKAKRSTVFNKVAEAFVKATKLDKSVLRFVFESARIQLNQTMEEIQIKDGDEIDVYLAQSGGGF